MSHAFIMGDVWLTWCIMKLMSSPDKEVKIQKYTAKYKPAHIYSTFAAQNWQIYRVQPLIITQYIFIYFDKNEYFYILRMHSIDHN